MTHNCRNCGSTAICGTELIIQARRPWRFESQWKFDLRVCSNCGLSDLFLPREELDWAKETLPLVVAKPKASST
jgi:hypothetical protein